MKNKLLSLLVALSMIISVLASLPVGAVAAEPAPYVEGEENAIAPAGSGTVEDPYRIYTKDQLLSFSAIVDDRPSASAKLMNDITFNEGLSFSFDVDTGLICVSLRGEAYYLGAGVKGFLGGNTDFDTACATAEQWYEYDTASDKYSKSYFLESFEPFHPISQGVPYKGVFDGQGHSVKGLWCTGPGYLGLFSSLGSGAQVKNVKIEGSLFMASGNCVGTIAGKMYAEEAVAVSVTGCESKTSVVVAKSYAGGIVGCQDAVAHMQSYVSVTDSQNRADVAAESYAGGILGASSRGSVGATAYGLTANFGTVYAADKNAGGITPNLVNGNSITNCYNAGDVYAREAAAGIAARSNRSVTRCLNSGKITASESYASGIVGHHSENNSVSYCANVGDVKAKAYAAGITVGTGVDKRAPRISDCYNVGNVQADVRAGGIACVSLYKSWSEGGAEKSVFTTLKNCISTDTVRANTVEADAICPYFDQNAPAASGCRTVSEYYVRSGAYAFENPAVFRQNMEADTYPVPSAKADGTLYKRYSKDGFVYYTNSSASSTHTVHVNENGDCRCDACAYTYSENHINLDGDCACDICGEIDGESHLFAASGMCTECGAFADGVSALAAGSLVISDTLTVALYMKLSPKAAENSRAYAKIKLGSSVTLEAPVNTAEREGEYFVFYVTVGAKQMKDEIKIQICGIAGGNGSVHTYSVEKYLDGLDRLDQTLTGLTDALRLWGRTAQIADGYDKNGVIGEGLTVPSITLPSDSSTVRTGGIEGLEHKNTSIAISEKFTIRFLFTGVEGVTFLVDGRKILPFTVSEKLGTFAVEITNIGIDELEREFTLTAIKEGEVYEVTHSLAAEICKRIKGGNSQEKHLNLYRALLHFSESLKNIPREIKYEMGGGSIITDLNSYSASTPTPLPTEGMSYISGGSEQKFIGWFADSEFTVPIKEIPVGMAGEYRVYAKWLENFANVGFSADKTYSEADGDDAVSFSSPAASGATLVASGGVLNWTASAEGSSFSLGSAIGKMSRELLHDGYVSYEISFKNIAMAAKFGIEAENGTFFELFRTSEDGKILVGDKELTLPEGSAVIAAVVSFDESTVQLYAQDGSPLIAPTRLISPYSAEDIKLLFASCADMLSGKVLTVLGCSGGNMAIDEIAVSPGHAFKRNHIEYELDGGSFKEGAEYPEAYVTEGEPTRLPSGELLEKISEDGKRRYIFGGWYADRELTVPIEEISVYSYGIVKVYAKWNMLFLDVDYDTATDPDVFETTSSKSADGLLYGVYSGVGTYKVFEDENGEKYLLAATENNGTQIIGSVTNTFSEISSPDLSISFEITLSANGGDLVRGFGEIDTELVRYTNIIDESNLTDTYVRLRAPINGKNTDLLYLFKLNTAGTVKMGSKVIAQLDLEKAAPVTLRIVADFKNGNLIAYDEDGNVTATESFALSAGASTYEQMLRLLTGECFCMRLNTDNSAIRLYSIKVQESNIFEK